MTDRFLTADEVSSILQISPSTLTGWRQKGEGPPFVKVGRKCVRYPEADLRTWVGDLARGATHD